MVFIERGLRGGVTLGYTLDFPILSPPETVQSYSHEVTLSQPSILTLVKCKVCAEKIEYKPPSSSILNGSTGFPF